MRIIVCSGGVRLWLPVPLCLASAAVRLLPESIFADMRKSVPEAYHGFVTKKFFRDIIQECRSELKRYKGLEIVRVEERDGTYVSIRI